MYDIFKELLTEKNLSVADVVKGTGLRYSMFTDWKNGKSTPKSDKRQKVADFLGVSLEYLDTGSNPEKRITKYDHFLDLIVKDDLFMESIQQLFSLPAAEKQSVYDFIAFQQMQFKKKELETSESTLTA